MEETLLRNLNRLKARKILHFKRMVVRERIGTDLNGFEFGAILDST